jgi:hypothetical protein
MANWAFPNGLEGLADGTIDYDTDTIKIAALDLGTPDAAIKAITGATNATPIVVTATGHGFANGDVVMIQGVGGNLAANNAWKIKNVTANTFELASIIDGTTNSVGSGAYTSGGVAVCLGPSAAGDHWDDFSAAVVGTPVTLSGKGAADGVLTASNPTLTSVTGNSIEAFAAYEDTGSEGTGRMLSYHDGQHLVVANAQASAGATSIQVEPLEQAIASGATLVFSNGASATLSAGASAGARSISVSALAATVAAGAYASAPVTSSGLPVIPNGGNINVTLDATNGLLKLRRY